MLSQRCPNTFLGEGGKVTFPGERDGGTFLGERAAVTFTFLGERGGVSFLEVRGGVTFQGGEGWRHVPEGGWVGLTFLGARVGVTFFGDVRTWERSLKDFYGLKSSFSRRLLRAFCEKTF